MSTRASVVSPRIASELISSSSPGQPLLQCAGRPRRLFSRRPLGFREYLIAHEQKRLIAALEAWHPKSALADSIHERAVAWMDRFTMVGGMPAVVEEDRGGGDARVCRALQPDLVAAYRDDFAKYAGRMDRRILDTVLYAVLRARSSGFSTTPTAKAPSYSTGSEKAGDRARSIFDSSLAGVSFRWRSRREQRGR
jgi:predicted AAA+ superfamily ATPase